MHPIDGVHINGHWLPGQGGTLDLSNPANGQAGARVSAADAPAVDAAVRAASAALTAWRETTPLQRADLLEAIASEVKQAGPHLVELQMQANGKPRQEAELDVADVVATFRYYATYCREHPEAFTSAVALPDPQFRAQLQMVPAGVVGLIVPWNFPMVTSAWKLAPALAAGCCVVLKPSELTPLAEIELIKLLVRAGLPDGVVNLVCGGGAVGAALTAHPGIAKLSFTGSNRVGQEIMRQAAQKLTRVSLELGGKSALIVLDSADLQQAVELAIGGAFFNAGQMCSATSRILVAEALYPAFCTAIREAAQSLRVAGPEDASAVMGPLISKTQQQRVLGFIGQGIADGGQLLCDGRPVAATRDGYFVGPTLFTNLPPESRLWQEEIFGPVACLRSFASDEEAIRLANDSAYGLVATVVGAPDQRSQRVVDALEVGLAWLNSPQVIFPHTAWGGFKHSGIGRELGPWGLQAFQEVKHVVSTVVA
jgi:betaine-aldehyde dehydrogenase